MVMSEVKKKNNANNSHIIDYMSIIIPENQLRLSQEGRVDVQSFASLRCYWLNNHFYSLRKAGKTTDLPYLSRALQWNSVTHTHRRTQSLWASSTK